MVAIAFFDELVMVVVVFDDLNVLFTAFGSLEFEG